MNRPNRLPTCCGQETTYVDNVPNKEYIYCRACKHEVDEYSGCKSCYLSPPSDASFEADKQAILDSVHYTIGIDPGKLKWRQAAPSAQDLAALRRSPVQGPPTLTHVVDYLGNCNVCQQNVVGLPSRAPCYGPTKQPAAVPPPPQTAAKQHHSHTSWTSVNGLIICNDCGCAADDSLAAAPCPWYGTPPPPTAAHSSHPRWSTTNSGNRICDACGIDSRSTHAPRLCHGNLPNAPKPPQPVAMHSHDIDVYGLCRDCGAMAQAISNGTQSAHCPRKPRSFKRGGNP